MIQLALLRNRANVRKLFVQSLLCMLALCDFGCSKSSGRTLIDVLKDTSGTSVVSIEHIALDTHNGLPSNDDVLNAKILRSIQIHSEIDAFKNALVSAHAPGDYNHPIISDELVLRVKTTNGVWTIFCRIVTTDNTRTCSIISGNEGETNINRMTHYEASLLVNWIDEYLMSR